MAQPLVSNSGQGSLSTRRGNNSKAEQHMHKQRAIAFFPGARGLQIADSNFTVVGGDVHNHYYHGERPKDIWAILQAIPNFRRIYQDMLSKATPGTGMWLLKGDKFRLWLEPNGDIKIFWGSGIPGAGKTLLASIVIARLEALRQESDAAICVCYVYFRYSDRSEVRVRDILEILVKQTLERHPECRALIEATYAQHLLEGSEPTEGQLLGLLRELADRMVCTFFVLDALDEAPTKTQLAVVKTLASLNVKLFITSRPLNAAVDSFPEACTFPIIAQGDDIDLHIAKRLAESADLQNLIRQAGPLLREEIVSTIKQNCGGMFLLASLQLDALCDCVSAHAVGRKLKAFSSRIDGVYSQTWDRILNQNADHVSLAKAVLVWVLNALRPMTVEELEQAVATSPETHRFEPDRLVPGTTLVSLCRGLVTVEEESHIVRLVHYTAKDALEGFLHESIPYPHSLLAAVCMTHLAECGFQNTTIASEEEFKRVLKEGTLLAYASEAWAFHAREALEKEKDDSSRRRAAKFIMESHAFPALTSVDRSAHFDILSPLHILALCHLPLVLIKDITVNNPNATTPIHQQSPLMLAARFGHGDLVAHLVTLSAIRVNLVETDVPALMEATREGHEGIVKILLAHHEIQINLVTIQGSSALIQAASRGHEGIVKLLLRHRDIHINLCKSGGWSALMLAASNGFEGIVKLLLGHPDLHVNLVTTDGWSALMLAAGLGHEGVVKALLARPGIHVNVVGIERWSALMLAARNGFEGIIKLLLGHPEIQVNLVNTEGLSALMLAAREGHEGIAKLLLGHREIQINLVKTDGWSALMLAAGLGHEGIVKLLLARPEIQANLAGSEGWPALFLAVAKGYECVVKLLLAHPEIQVNLCANQGLSALMLAAGEGHEGIVRILLAHHEIQINLVTIQGSSALMQAASRGHEGIVKLLLRHRDIQVNLCKTEGWSALMLAARNGFDGIVKLLLGHPDLQVNLATTDGWSALMLAVGLGREGVVRVLLPHPKIRVNLVSVNGWSALILAARNGFEGIVKFLLGHPDIQVNLVTNQGFSALLMAASNGHKGIVRLLLAADGVDFNASSKDRETAIKIAAKDGNEAIVRMLLDIPSVDTTIRSITDGHTAISAAQANGHGGIVDLLQDFELRRGGIARPAKIEASDENELSSDSESDTSDFYHDAEEEL